MLKLIYVSSFSFKIFMIVAFVFPFCLGSSDLFIYFFPRYIFKNGKNAVLKASPIRKIILLLAGFYEKKKNFLPAFCSFDCVLQETNCAFKWFYKKQIGGALDWILQETNCSFEWVSLTRNEWCI